MAPTTSNTLDTSGSAQAITALKKYLETGNLQDWDKQDFINTPLTKLDAETARDQLWNKWEDIIKQTKATPDETSIPWKDDYGRTGDITTPRKVLGEGPNKIQYFEVQRSGKSLPSDGLSLFICMHGGGGSRGNDDMTEWKSNNANWDGYLAWFSDKGYSIENAICIIPRAPDNTWDMWHKADMDEFLDRLISYLLIEHDSINPNKVYLMGYSAGGNGAFQLATRSPDRWAAVEIGGGHPEGAYTNGNVYNGNNGGVRENIYNLPVSIDVGEKDHGFMRHCVCAEWVEKLNKLKLVNAVNAKADDFPYPYRFPVYQNMTHGDMSPISNKTMAQATTFLQKYVRNPIPDTVVWYQTNVAQSRFYWLATDINADDKTIKTVKAKYVRATNTIELEVKGFTNLKVRVSDDMMNLDLPVKIKVDDKEYTQPVARTIDTIHNTLKGRGDKAMTFFGEIEIQVVEVMYVKFNGVVVEE